MNPQAFQRNAGPQPGYAPQMQQQPMPPAPMAGAYQQPYKGTLAPGTRVKVGNITVTVKRYLSEGGFAHVYLVTTAQPIPMPSSVTGAIGASIAAGAAAERGETVHVLKRMAVPDKAALADVRREVEVHKLLRNQANIVHFIEASATALQGGGYEIFILMEYCSGGGIISLMNARLRDRLREEEILKIFGDVCAGVAVMHHLDPPLMHRDLKVENILMAPSTDPGTIPGSRSTSSNLKATFKLCDFGSAAPVLSRKPAKSIDEVKRVEADLNKHTTLQYRAPEMVDVYQRRVIDEKADIWALGVLLYKLCYYTTPFEENGGGPLAILNVKYRIPPQPVYSDRLKQLIHSLLKEQSTDRPTIDQVIINVHQILGTRPPQAALHYASAAASGKIAGPIPTPVSGARPSSTADASSLQGKSKRTGGIDANLISMGPSKKELEQEEAKELELQKQSITPMRRGRPTKPPVDSADTPTKKAGEDMVKSNSRAASTAVDAPAPQKSAPLWSVPDSKSSSVQTGSLIEGFGDSFSPTATNSEDPPDLPKRPSPSSLSPDRSGDTPKAASDRPVDKNLLRASSSHAPSPTLSPLRHSPALPGFSVAPSPSASPLPTAARETPQPPSVHQSSTPRDELTDRFPSLEDLDARYAAPAQANSSPASSAATSAPSSLPSSSGNHVNVPGLANRASVGAMAGRFERPFEPQRPGSGRAPLSKSATIAAFSANDTAPKARPDSVTKRWQPSVIAHNRVGKGQEAQVSDASSFRKASASKDWLTGDVSDHEDAKEAKGEPREDRDTKVFASQMQDPADDTRQDAAGQEIEQPEEPSSDEDEPAQPEEAVAQRPAFPPRLSANRLSSFSSSRTDTPSSQQPNESETNGRPAKPERPRITPGRVKAPSWLVDAVDSPTAAERLMSTSSLTSQGSARKSPAAESFVYSPTDASAAEQLDEATRRAQDQLEELLRGPADAEPAVPAASEVEQDKVEGMQPEPSPVSNTQVKAPAWDEDENEDEKEELKALPKPDIAASKPAVSSSRSTHEETTTPVQEQRASPPAKPATSSVASRWNSASRQTRSPPVSTKQLVDVATSPVSRASPSEVEAVKDKFGSFSLGTPSASASAAAGPLQSPSQSGEGVGSVRRSSMVAARQAAFSASSSASSTAGSQPPRSEPAIIQPQPRRPTPMRPAKSAHLRATSVSSSGMKPWEREAALSAAASQGGIVKNSALPAASTARLSDIRDEHDNANPSKAEDTFTGVSSLISRWQHNVESNAPGWGRIGSNSIHSANDPKPPLTPKVANHPSGLVKDRANGTK